MRYREIAELHKSLAAKDAEIKELKQGNETQMKEELQMALDKKQKEALRDANHLTGQVNTCFYVCMAKIIHDMVQSESNHLPR